MPKRKRKSNRDANGLTPKAKAQMDKVLEKFQTGDLSDITRVATLRLPEGVPAATWTWRNRYLAYIQTGGEMDARTGAEWKRMGYQIKKGATACWIMAPRFAKPKEDDPEQKRPYIGAWPSHRIPASAVEPIDPDNCAPLPTYEPVELPPLMDLAERLGIDVAYRPTPGDRLGDCQVDGSHINLGTHDARTWYHELGHALHARIEGNLAKFSDAYVELIAEFTGCVLAALYGDTDNSGKAWNYIKQWHDDPFKAVMGALDIIQQILAYIFDNEENAEIEQGDTLIMEAVPA